ncbi:Hypothetical predicted protein [Olea europaea subsp. europaea]|uniref:Uncharacterized protein n=1 Tax=Olea europaea subsp. europaea TaxID=158383 RepID=A0A8S0PA93_OLEEU|nr:Hypothetical predicted protein [Olea europaea subsp. europaea]
MHQRCQQNPQQHQNNSKPPLLPKTPHKTDLDPDHHKQHQQLMTPLCATASEITCSAPTHTSAFVSPEKRQIYSGGSRLAGEMTTNLDEEEQRVKRVERDI